MIISEQEWPVGSWLDLADRLDAAGALGRWAAAEPVLAQWASVHELPGVLAVGACRDRADEVLGALVRCAACDGADDPDAVLVVLHLLRRGVYALAGRLTGTAELGDVVAELTCRIRMFPWRRRTQRIAANLLLDTKHTLWAEHHSRSHPDTKVQVLDPHSPVWMHYEPLLPTQPDSGPDLQDLAVLLDWARRSGAVKAQDMDLLLTTQRQASPVVAADRGMNERTVRRRRARALEVLRRAGVRYLAA